MIPDNPRILLVNDDGIDAPGLQVLRKIAGSISSEVWVVAPSENQSGAGHRFTFGTEMTLTQHEDRVFSLPGSPADCVVVGCTHVMRDARPHLVLSGVNQGQNLGDIIHCSGTAAGAREGALQGAVGIAISQAVDFAREHEVDWGSAETFGADVIKKIAGYNGSPDAYFNVNFPKAIAGRTPSVRVVAHQRFSRSPFSHYPSKNAGKFFVAIPETPMPLDEQRDFHVLHHDHAITVTPLRLDITADDTMAGLRDHFMGGRTP